MTRRGTRRKSEPASGESPSSGMLRAGFPHFTASLVRPVSKVFIASLHHGQPMLRVHQLCNASSSSTWASIAWWCNFCYHFEYKIYIMKESHLMNSFLVHFIYLFLIIHIQGTHVLYWFSWQDSQSNQLHSAHLGQFNKAQGHSVTQLLAAYLYDCS